MTIDFRLYPGDARKVLAGMPANSFDMVLTSPPYFNLRWYQTEPVIWVGGSMDHCDHDFVQRNYNLHSGRGDAQRSGKYSEQDPIADMPMSDATCRKCGAWKGELVLEPAVEMFIDHLAPIFDEVRRVLKPSGTCWIIMGDKYSGSGGAGGDYNPGGKREGQPRYGRATPPGIPAKSLCFAPYRLAIEMTKRGWIARNLICWHKPNRMPENVDDRFTMDWEPVLFFSKSRTYYFHKTDNNNNKRRSVWSINTKGQSDAHYATFPEELCQIPILAGSKPGDTIMDPFMGSGTTGVCAIKLERRFVGIDMNPNYVEVARQRIQPLIGQTTLLSFSAPYTLYHQNGLELQTSSSQLPQCRPFVKWVGGKTQLLPELEKHAPKNFARYFEPFLGAGALFFHLATSSRQLRFTAYLSDINSELINAYIVIKDNVDKLIQALQVNEQGYKANPTEFYYKLRDDVHPESLTDIESAARFITLNKTCFNGVYRVNSKGEFNVPIGDFKKTPTICDSTNLLNVSIVLKDTNAHISVSGYKTALELASGEQDFIYLDPPYKKVSKTANFTSYTKGGFTDKDQIALHETFKKLDRKGCKILLSNSDTLFIRELYSDFKEFTSQISGVTRAVNSKADKRTGHTELLICNYER